MNKDFTKPFQIYESAPVLIFDPKLSKNQVKDYLDRKKKSKTEQVNPA